MEKSTEISLNQQIKVQGKGGCSKNSLNPGIDGIGLTQPHETKRGFKNISVGWEKEIIQM